jgi:predicted permease
MRVTASFLSTLGYVPTLGSGISPNDDLPGGPQVIVLSDALWRDHFGADARVVGRTAWLDGDPFTVVGVLPPDFVFPENADYTDFLTPLHLDPDPRDAGENYPVLASLRPGVSRETAQEDLARVSRAFRAEHPDLVSEGDRGMRLATYQELFVGDLAGTLWVLFAAVSAVLLIAALNVANLMLARASDRREEMAVRAALGASRGRIMRQVVSEGVLLAALAGLGGFLLARWGVDALLALSPERLPRTQRLDLNGAVLLFSGAVTLATGLGASLGAAIAGSRGSGAFELRRAGGNSRAAGRSMLLAMEAGLSMVLLVGAGVLIGTLRELRSVDPGFVSAGVVTARLSRLPGTFEDTRDVAELERRLSARLGADPAILSVSATSTLPLERGLNLPMAVPGRDDEGHSLEWRAVAPDYATALGIELVQGREFTDDDGVDAPPVALVNQAFAEQYFPDGKVLGRRVEIGRFRGRYLAPAFEVAPAEIVGVIGDVRESSLKRGARATVLVPLAQVPENLAGMPILLVRARDTRIALERVRAVVAEVAPGLPEPELGSLDDVVVAAMAPERFHALLMAAFALVALVLTAFGIYGVVSYRVARRTREVGIRMALGAGRAGLTWRIVVESMRPVLLGLAVGVAGALALARFLASLVWGISPTDPGIIAIVACLLALVACIASWLPVRGATGGNPATTLRWD